MKTNYKTIFIFLCLVYSISGMEDISDGSGVPGEYLLELAGDALEFGRGGGSIALVKSSSSIYHNPAGLGSIDYMEAMITYARLFNGFNFYNGAFAYPFGKYGTVGIGILGLVSPEGQVFDEFGIPTGENFKSNKNTIFISYGKLFIDRFGMGANVKISTHSIHDYFGMGFGFDFGFTARAYDWLVGGISLQHIGGPRITLDSEEDQFSTTLKIGLGSELLDQTLSINADFHLLELIPDQNAYTTDNVKRPMRWSFGTGYWIIPYFALRAGINGSIISNNGTDVDLRMVTLGMSCKVKQFSADYAFLIQTESKDFRSTPGHCVSLHYSFGKPIPEKEVELDEKLKNIDKIENMHSIEQLYIRGQYQKAFDMVTTLKEKYPKDEDVEKLMVQVREKLSVEKSDELFAEAQKAFEMKNYDQAEELLKSIIELSPSNVKADSLRRKILTIKEISSKMESVKMFYSQNQFEDMVKELNVVLSIDSTHEEALIYKEKIKDFLIKQETEKLYTLAYKYYHDDKDVEKANNELQKLLSLKPDHKEANTLYKTISKEIKKMYLQKVGQMVNQDKLDVNDTALKKLIEIKAQDQIVEIRRLYDNKQYSQALVSVDAVLEQESKNSHALELKKLILEAQSLEKAELMYNEALKLFNEKKLDETESKLVEALNLSPDHEKAGELLNEVRKVLREKNLTAAAELMKSGKREDLEAAQKIVDEYLSVDTKNAGARKILVDIQSELLIIEANEYIDNDEYEKANKAIQKALTLNPDSKKVQEAFKNMKDVLDVFEDEE